MNKQFPTGWVLATLTLIAYFSIGILLTGEAALLIGVLLFVLVTWFSIYKAQYKSLGNLELVTRIYDDFKGTVERTVERVTQEETQRRTAAEHKMQVSMERERRRANRTPTKEDTAAGKYAQMIENRVREAKVDPDESEGTRQTGP